MKDEKINSNISRMNMKNLNTFNKNALNQDANILSDCN